MANNKKLVEAITSMEDDFAQWYTDVVKKAELCGYTSVKGCMAIKPAGYAIWENIQHELDRRFKETGVQNVYMPIFIPPYLDFHITKNFLAMFIKIVIFFSFILKNFNSYHKMEMCIRDR